MKNAILNSLLFVFVATGTSAISAAESQIVIEDLTRRELRVEIDKIQTEFYRVFNSSNSDRDLTIVCYDHIPTGSHIKEESCEPRFMIEKRAENVEDSRLGVDQLLSPGQLEAAVVHELQTLTEAMAALAQESDYFKELGEILGMLQERMQEISR